MDPVTVSLGRLLRERGKARWLGGCILTYGSAPSTNDVALDLARRGAPHGSLILADRQTSGRGRWKRHWISPEGGLYLSVILRPPENSEGVVPLVPTVAAVATAEGIIEACDSAVAPRIRWPNDVLIDSRKAAGILCESSFSGNRPELLVAGIGVNVNQPPDVFPEELRAHVTSLCMTTGAEHEKLHVAACLCERLEIWWEKCIAGSGEILPRWNELAWGGSGMNVRVRSRDGAEFEAATEGITEDGGLLVRLADGTKRTLRSEEVLYFRGAEA